MKSLLAYSLLAFSGWVTTTNAQCSYPEVHPPRFTTHLENSDGNTITNWHGNVTNNYTNAGYLPDPTCRMPQTFQLINEILLRNRLPIVSDTSVRYAVDYRTRLEELDRIVQLFEGRLPLIKAGSDYKLAEGYINDVKIDLSAAIGITTCIQPVVFTDSASGLLSYYYLKSAFDSLGITYTQFGRMSEGRKAFKFGSKWGFLDADGSLVIEAKYDSVREFHEGYALVYYPNGKYYIDTMGDIMPIDLSTYKFADDFSDGVAVVRRADELTSYNYIDKKGNLLFTSWFEKATDFNFGKAAVYGDAQQNETDVKNKRAPVPRWGWYIIDTAGNSYYETITIYAKSLSNFNTLGLARFSTNGQSMGLIDTGGKIIFQPKYEHIYSYCGNWTAARISFYSSSSNSGKTNRFGFLDSDGRELTQMDYLSVEYFDDDYAIVQKGHDATVKPKSTDHQGVESSSGDSPPSYYTLLNNLGNDVLHGLQPFRKIILRDKATHTFILESGPSSNPDLFILDMSKKHPSLKPVHKN